MNYRIPELFRFTLRFILQFSNINGLSFNQLFLLINSLAIPYTHYWLLPRVCHCIFVSSNLTNPVSFKKQKRTSKFSKRESLLRLIKQKEESPVRLIQKNNPVRLKPKEN